MRNVMEGLKGGILANPPLEAAEIMKSVSPAKSPVEWGLPEKFQSWRDGQFELVLDAIDSEKRFFTL